MFPFIRRAQAEGYGLLLFNGNDNEVDHVPIRSSSNPVEHGLYVWDAVVSKCAAKDIVIIAHSFGGVVTSEIATARVCGNNADTAIQLISSSLTSFLSACVGLRSLTACTTAPTRRP